MDKEFGFRKGRSKSIKDLREECHNEYAEQQKNKFYKKVWPDI